jgi:hypothetical protein
MAALSVNGGVSMYGITPPGSQQAATAQSSFASTVITTVSSTSLTTLDLTKINALIARVEEMRVYLAQTRTDLIAVGIQKGSA